MTRIELISRRLQVQTRPAANETTDQSRSTKTETPAYQTQIWSKFKKPTPLFFRRAFSGLDLRPKRSEEGGKGELWEFLDRRFTTSTNLWFRVSISNLSRAFSMHRFAKLLVDLRDTWIKSGRSRKSTSGPPLATSPTGCRLAHISAHIFAP
jgi:hypothetical protein